VSERFEHDVNTRSLLSKSKARLSLVVLTAEGCQMHGVLHLRAKVGGAESGSRGAGSEQQQR